ncbi:MarR family transcriptional regulator [Mycobacteroides abscessus subsp. abscessus]|uniref:MarR family winged helix-turn-helix transcriptional regulator n=1 Tax=Mycobacteroides abscessus TaxID=36809 RepID=UPI00266B900F|nr:MarR family transcriptional regulator [Mycobacteroides abscessus]MDO3340087.1 MarR family transcriptional regulator [Mycobacteroides abscessus subsp. abscessus]
MNQDEPANLGYLFQRLMAVRRPLIVSALRPLGLGFPEFACLRFLQERPGSTSADLARLSNVTAQAMHQVLQRLREAGLIARPAAASSGRALPVKLTHAGRQLLQRAQTAVQAADEKIWVRLSPSDRRELERILETLVNSVLDDTAQPPAPYRPGSG